jgi:hypothetical protein
MVVRLADERDVGIGRSMPKALLRAKAERTIDALWDAVGEIIALFKPDECASHFTACGYDPT